MALKRVDKSEKIFKKLRSEGKTTLLNTEKDFGSCLRLYEQAKKLDQVLASKEVNSENTSLIITT